VVAERDIEPAPDPGDLVRIYRASSRFFGGWGIQLVSVSVVVIGFCVVMLVNDWEVTGALGIVLVSALLWARYVRLRRTRPRGGWPSYSVFTEGLVVTTDTTRRVVRWDEVQSVQHYPFVAQRFPGGYSEAYGDHCEVTLEGEAEPLRITGARWQSFLSQRIVNSTRPRILQRLLTEFEQEDMLQLGELTLTRDQVQDADGHHLPWSQDWTFRKIPRPDGWELVIGSPDGQKLSGLVPEPTVAIELLETVTR
jgi:hypothetical protein